MKEQLPASLISGELACGQLKKDSSLEDRTRSILLSTISVIPPFRKVIFVTVL
jgi:hypothetical protein